jgi:hypothetical protein
MDDFSDDGFDDLNVTVLDELENNAIQSTQAQRQVGLTQQEFEYDEYDDDDLGDTVVKDDLRGNSIRLSEKAIASTIASRLPAQHSPPQQNRWGPIGTISIPPTHFRPQPIGSALRSPTQVSVGARLSQYGPRQSQDRSYSQMRPPAIPRLTPNQSRHKPSHVPQQSGSTSLERDALQARIHELELKLQTKDGEIDIVRRNLEKHRQDHDREIQAIKRQTAEQISKSERVAEAAKAAQQTATTELQFTRRDLKDELDRAKRREKDGGTPKKPAAAKTWGVSDGFEDVEMAASPSKGNRGRNPGAVASVIPEPPARLTRTPTKSKRKRPNIESPIMALETDEDITILVDDNAAMPAKTVDALAVSGLVPRRRNPFGVDVCTNTLTQCANLLISVSSSSKSS